MGRGQGRSARGAQGGQLPLLTPQSGTVHALPSNAVVTGTLLATHHAPYR